MNTNNPEWAQFVLTNGERVAINPEHVASVFRGRTYAGGGDEATSVVMNNSIGYTVQDSLADTLDKLDNALEAKRQRETELAYRPSS